MDLEILLSLVAIVGIVSGAGVLIAKMFLKTDEYSGKMKRNMEKYVNEPLPKQDIWRQTFKEKLQGKLKRSLSPTT